MDDKTMCLDKSIVRFLCNVYFTTGENDFEKASFRAYLDFCRTIKFKDDYKGDKKEKEKEDIKKAVSRLIENFVKTIEHTPDVFDNIDDKNDNIINSHKKLCRMIINKFSEFTQPNTFTYGHAQKWVNMTLKYLYVLDKCKERSTYDAIVSYFHVPIDNIILDMCSNPEEHNKNLPEGMQALPEGFSVKREGEEKDAWSTWKDYTYDSYREKLEGQIKTCYGENTPPLIWELENWAPKKDI